MCWPPCSASATPPRSPRRSKKQPPRKPSLPARSERKTDEHHHGDQHPDVPARHRAQVPAAVRCLRPDTRSTAGGAAAVRGAPRTATVHLRRPGRCHRVRSTIDPRGDGVDPDRHGRPRVGRPGHRPADRLHQRHPHAVPRRQRRQRPDQTDRFRPGHRRHRRGHHGTDHRLVAGGTDHRRARRIPGPGRVEPGDHAQTHRAGTRLADRLGIRTVGVLPDADRAHRRVPALVGLHQNRGYTHLRLTGSNERTAYVSGIPIGVMRVTAHAVGGVFAGLAGLAFTGLIGSGDATQGTTYTLIAVTALVLGGTSLAGGAGGALGSVIGAIDIFLISYVLATFNLGSLSSFVVQLTYGVVLVAALMVAVFLGRSRQRKALS
ncbi:ABC transporter permease [Nakamurella sp. GG22]